MCMCVYYPTDPRVADWFMMSSPVPSFLICLVYMVITKIGPIFMANRKPFEIRNVMLVYNIAMVLLSAYILEEVSVLICFSPGMHVICLYLNYWIHPLPLSNGLLSHTTRRV